MKRFSERLAFFLVGLGIGFLIFAGNTAFSSSKEKAIHTVQEGDTIEAIARKYTVLPWQLRQINGMDAEDDLIHPGQELQIPKVNWSVRSYTGLASWYGPSFHGKKRADGGVYNQYEVLVAHRTLPLGMKVRITNLQNGRSIIAPVLDRGPYAKDDLGNYTREIDLSRGAALRLDAVKSGVVPVRIEPLQRVAQK